MDQVKVLSHFENLVYSISQRSVSGYCLEFGVHVGKSVKILAEYLKNEYIYGFDSFEGLPEEWYFGKDKHPQGTFALSTLPKVPENVILIEGWFEESLPIWLETHSDKVSFVHIDSDLYSSAKTVLSNLNSRIVPGTIILFDEYKDWGTHRYTNWADGEYKACQEWLYDNNREIKLISRTEHVQATFKVIK